MEEDEIQAQACKFPRVGKIGSKGSTEQYPDEEVDGDLRRRGGGGSDGSTNRFHSWHHSSRIIRVSRASGGKDRHSKVMTSKGLRDRRVRLSVTTAIQFYDLQDRLGYDQPSKAVEWLIKAAEDAITELPSLNNAFPDTPKQPSDEKRGSVVGTEHAFDSVSADAELDGEANYHQQNQCQNLSLSKSACSSTSETSKGSGVSLSRSEIRVNRVKARERARERAVKEKEKENESRLAHHQNPISQTASFTELLTGGISNVPTTTSPTGSVHQSHPGHDEPTLFNKAAARQQWPSTPMDYFSLGLLGPSSSRTHPPQSSSGFSGQIQLGNSLPQPMSVSQFNVAGDNHSDQLQHFSFIDHLIPAVVTSQQPGGGGGGDYNLNFTISSGLAGFNRGTLQSNSPSLLPHHLQRFSPMDGSNVPFFMGGAAAAAAASAVPTMENHHHHQFPPGFDGRLQLYYGDGSRQSDQKGKGKN